MTTDTLPLNVHLVDPATPGAESPWYLDAYAGVPSGWEALTYNGITSRSWTTYYHYVDYARYVRPVGSP